LNGLSCWPADVVTRSNGRIGLIVPAFPKNVFFKTTGSDAKISLCGKEKRGSWFANPAQRFGLVAPSERGDFRGMLSCCRLIARAVDDIHEAGRAHGDISTHSVLVDPVAGDALLTDCDIVFKPGESASSVIGSMGFIAPEIVETCNNPQGPQVLPNQETDRHSLAVLIYSLLLCRHPLEGAAVWDEDDEEWEDKIRYGKAKNQLRSRLQLSYDDKNWWLKPYASAELYNSWSIEKIRYTVGVDFNINKHNSLSVFYRFQDQRDTDSDDYDPDMHYLGIGYKFKL
jgi:serine/threonine protein kinase